MSRKLNNICTLPPLCYVFVMRTPGLSTGQKKSLICTFHLHCLLKGCWKKGGDGILNGNGIKCLQYINGQTFCIQMV